MESMNEVPRQRDPREDWSPITPVIGCDIPNYTGAFVLLRKKGDKWRVVYAYAPYGSLREAVCHHFRVERLEDIAEHNCQRNLFIKTRYVDYSSCPTPPSEDYSDTYSDYSY